MHMKPGNCKPILVLSLMLVSPLALAQQSENPAAPSSAPASETQHESKVSPPENTAPQAPRAPTRFTPSEKIRADDAVSFPVDI